MKLHLVYITLLVLCLEYSCDQASKLDSSVKGIYNTKPASHLSTLLDVQRRGIVECPGNSTCICSNNEICCRLQDGVPDVYVCCSGVCCGDWQSCCEGDKYECYDGLCLIEWTPGWCLQVECIQLFSSYVR